MKEMNKKLIQLIYLDKKIEHINIKIILLKKLVNIKYDILSYFAAIGRCTSYAAIKSGISIEIPMQ